MRNKDLIERQFDKVEARLKKIEYLASSNNTTTVNEIRGLTEYIAELRATVVREL